MTAPSDLEIERDAERTLKEAARALLACELGENHLAPCGARSQAVLDAAIAWAHAARAVDAARSRLQPPRDEE